MNKRPPLSKKKKKNCNRWFEIFKPFLNLKKNIYEVLGFEVTKKFAIFQFKINMDNPDPYPQYQQSRLDHIGCEI